MLENCTFPINNGYINKHEPKNLEDWLNVFDLLATMVYELAKWDRESHQLACISICNLSSASQSPEPVLYVVQKWINPATGKLKFSRHTSDNVEQRTLAAAELFQSGYYTSIAAAAREAQVAYGRLRSRLSGAKPVTENGGNHTLLTDTQEEAILCWAHRRVTQGHNIQHRERKPALRLSSVAWAEICSSSPAST